MIWEPSDRFDPRARIVADRHYSRQQPGTNQFMKPGSCMVLYANVDGREAVWGTSWQKAEWVKHPWPGAWECSIFRNEGAALSSTMIRDAIAATRWRYGEPPSLGMITFVDPGRVRRKRDPGRAFIRAGFIPIACMLRSRLIVLRLAPEDMPPARAPVSRQGSLWDRAA